MFRRRSHLTTNTASSRPDQVDASTSLALQHLLRVLGVLLVAVALTYAVPALQRFRPWRSGDAPLLSRLVQSWSKRLDVPLFAGAGGQTAASSVNAIDELGEAVASQLDEALVAELPAAPRRSGSLRPKTPRASLPGSAPAGSAPAGLLPASLVDATDYRGIKVGIEDPQGVGMESFYAKLLRTASRRDATVTRIAHYGDSSIATDHITATLRRKLQQRFGDAGHGFVLIASGYLPYRHRDLLHRASEAWSLVPIMYAQEPQGLYGYGGVQVRSKAGALATFGTDSKAPIGGSVAVFELYYQKYNRGGDLRLRVDDGAPQTLSTLSPVTVDAYERIELADGAHRLELRHAGGGSVRLYGVAMERGGPGLVYDSLGLVGARAGRLLNFDATHIAGQLAHRQVDLLILGFGGNEAGDPVSSVERYQAAYIKVIRRMRGDRREMSCLVFSPLDQGHVGADGKVVTMPSVPRIVEAQRRAALAEGCAFYSTFDAMGGKDSMRRWYASRPRLALGDLRHATPTGYEVIATMFYKALLQGFAEYQQRRSAVQPP